MKNKNNILVLMAAVLAGITMGCNRSDSGANITTTSDTNPPSATQQVKYTATNAWADVKEGTTNAWANIKDTFSSAMDYSYEKKDAFVADATNDLAALDQKIQELSDKAATAGDNVKADAQAKLQELRAKRAVLDQKLTDVKNSTDANWNDAKTAFKSSYDDVKSSVKSTWQWLKDKMS